VEELVIVHHRFPESHFLLLSEELTGDFVKQVTYNSQSFSILLKDCQREEIDAAFDAIQNGSYYICRQISNHLSSPKNNISLEDNRLTNTEREILRFIASGKSTKQIAADRFLSVHTVITHRKNIFRKLEVNNVYEATKYALRAGIVDASDYFI
jgi:DNA-binding NarL/FixJ family response regulator